MTLEEAFTKGWKAGSSGVQATREEFLDALEIDRKRFIAALKREKTFSLLEISAAVGKACTCGGGAIDAHDDKLCSACEVWKILTQ